ncbi:hypothetical protein M0R45_009102 [Rubus argutus]|uniref:Uncharacterized protein n=1 Tax=Rubus argutus TaxID=59490 RepID=A0AAW1Y4W1_RUBAR
MDWTVIGVSVVAGLCRIWGEEELIAGGDGEFPAELVRACEVNGCWRPWVVQRRADNSRVRWWWQRA